MGIMEIISQSEADFALTSLSVTSHRARRECSDKIFWKFHFCVFETVHIFDCKRIIFITSIRIFKCTIMAVSLNFG